MVSVVVFVTSMCYPANINIGCVTSMLHAVVTRWQQCLISSLSVETGDAINAIAVGLQFELVFTLTQGWMF